MRLAVEREGREYLLLIDGEECGSFATRLAAWSVAAVFAEAARESGLRVVVLRSAT